MHAGACYYAIYKGARARARARATKIAQDKTRANFGASFRHDDSRSSMLELRAPFKNTREKRIPGSYMSKYK